MNRKAQAASSSAILVIVITVLIILYILFLPPEDRDQLLRPNVTDPDNGVTPATGVILREQVGRIEYIGFDERIYDLSSFTVSTDTHARVIASKTSIYVKNSMFDDISDRMDFEISPGLTHNMLISFNVERNPRGILHITLNDQTIYRGELREGNSPPIHIDAGLLESRNTLRFAVNSPGLAFWRYNQYDLRNIRVLGDVKDISLSENIQEIVLTDKEYENMETARIRYTPLCEQRDIRDFEVRLNNRRIFSGIPDCNVLNTQTISKEDFREGRNTFEFRVGEGHVLVDSLRVTTNLKDPEHPVYYFFLKDEFFEDDDDEYKLKPNRDVILEFSFPNTDQKRFEVFINGYLLGINTARTQDSRNINHFVRPGTNSIEIRPQHDLTITEMRVRVR